MIIWGKKIKKPPYKVGETGASRPILQFFIFPNKAEGPIQNM